MLCFLLRVIRLLRQRQRARLYKAFSQRREWGRISKAGNYYYFVTSMRYLLFILCLFEFLTSLAQKDTVEYYMDYYNYRCEPYFAYYVRRAYKEEGLWHVKDYYDQERSLQMDGNYMDDSLTVEHGMFFYYHPNGKIKKKVRFINGHIEGLVREYDATGRLVDSAFYKRGYPWRAACKWNDKGQMVFKAVYDDSGYGRGEEWTYYDDGKLSSYGRTTDGYEWDSVWTYYYPSGVVSCKDYFETGTRTKRECFDETGALTATPCEDADVVVQGGEKNMMRIINKYFHFPEHFKLKGADKAMVLVKFAIDTDGRVTDAELLKKFHPEFDREVLYAISKIPKAKPAIKNNRPVKRYYIMPFVFTDGTW